MGTHASVRTRGNDLPPNGDRNQAPADGEPPQSSSRRNVRSQAPSVQKSRNRSLTAAQGNKQQELISKESRVWPWEEPVILGSPLLCQNLTCQVLVDSLDECQGQVTQSGPVPSAAWSPLPWTTGQRGAGLFPPQVNWNWLRGPRTFGVSWGHPPHSVGCLLEVHCSETLPQGRTGNMFLRYFNSVTCHPRRGSPKALSFRLPARRRQPDREGLLAVQTSPRAPHPVPT